MKKIGLMVLFLVFAVLILVSCNEEQSVVQNQAPQSSQEEHVHEYGAWETVREATCEEDGIKTQFCSCGYKQEKTIEATGHTEVKDKAVAATCTTEGKSEGKHCSKCNKVIVAQEAIKATGHTEVADKAVVATCTSNGKTEGKHCSKCNKVIVAQETIKATGHTEVADKAVAATCTSEGKTEGKHCSKCNFVIDKQMTISKVPHSIGKECSMCGINYYEELVEYIIANGTYSTDSKGVAYYHDGLETYSDDSSNTWSSIDIEYYPTKGYVVISQLILFYDKYDDWTGTYTFELYLDDSDGTYNYYSNLFDVGSVSAIAMTGTVYGSTYSQNGSVGYSNCSSSNSSAISSMKSMASTAVGILITFTNAYFQIEGFTYNLDQFGIKIPQ